MATINEELLGKLNGSLGNIVIKNNKGKRYAAAKPGSFIPGADPDSVERRKRFGLAVKLAKRINKIDYLKTIWKKFVSGAATPFNLMIKTNYPYVSSSSLSDQVTLAPSGGFEIAASSFQINPSGVQVIIDAIGTDKGIDSIAELKIIMVSLIYLHSPIEKTATSDAFISLISDAQDTSLSTQLIFDIPLSYQESNLFNKYWGKKGFFCLLTLDPDDNPMHYSSTFVNS